VFVLAAAGVVPLAGLLGEGTEQLAAMTGPRIGGLLNASLGNAAELIIGVSLVARGELEVVRASITGSIVGNLLLVLGLAFFIGGLKRRELRFSAQAASTHVVSMALAVIGVVMPTVFARGVDSTHFREESVSIAVAVVLIALYAASLVFSLVTHSDAFRGEYLDEEPATWTMPSALVVLGIAAVLIAVESELLVGALEHAVDALGLSPFWIGMILVPVVGNAAEHSTAVLAASKGKGDLALDIAVGSSAQVALLVTPLLVFAGLLWNHDLTLVFTGFEVAALIGAVVVVALISLDGKTNWLEGAQLLGLYAIIAIAAFYIGKT
jgi:Ca2+:H+ antiporter